MQNFVVYKSSAGSGKTFTLVREFLRLALADEKKLSVSYRRILAITFTNKAAAEMKERVIRALSDLADRKTNKLTTQLLTLLNVNEAELSRRSAIVLNHILHHYSDLSIGTIDSFTHKIVKTFAHDLRLPVNFNIELDTGSFYQKVISLLLSRIGEDEYIGNLLRDYALTRAEDNASWDPQTYIEEFSRLLLKENAQDFVSKLNEFSSDELENFRNEFNSFIRHYRTYLRTEANKALEIIAQAGLTDEDFIYKSNGPQKFFQKCADIRVKAADCGGARISDALHRNKWAAPGSVQAVAKIQDQLKEIALRLIDFITANYSHYTLCKLMGRQMYPLMLLKKIEEISQEQKQEERLVFISEFNQRIYDVINNEPTPFIYERLGERYQHYLLDEFQDTSSLQWQNILPLLDNSLSNGWFNLIVGDGKQSIYRWRNANVKQFATLPDVENPSGNPLLEERKAALQRNFSGQLLSSNFRSAKTIIDFNNNFFSKLSSSLLSEDFRSIYHEHEQKAEKQDEGYVTIQCKGVERDKLDELTCNAILNSIQEAREDGYSDTDICILCRTNNHGNTIASFLVSRGINVISSDSLLLTHNLEINTILAYLAYLTNREDQISAATVMNYLLQKKKISYEVFDKSLQELGKGESLFNILNANTISLPESGVTLSNLFDQCVGIVKALGMNEGAFHYVRFFLDEVNEFLVHKSTGISGFLEWWERRKTKASLVIPDSTNAVRIMTIHASKGLEFPVVIVPYCTWPVYRASDSWVNIQDEKVKLPVTVVSLSSSVSESGFGKELETEQQEQVLDNLNLLYVAFTRAVDRLHVLSLYSSGNKQAGVHGWIADFVSISSTSPEQFTLGQRSARPSAGEKKETSVLPLLPLRFNSDTNNIRIKNAFLRNSGNEEAQKQGILIHWLLSQIRMHSDLDNVLNRALQSGEIRGDEKEQVGTHLRGILQHPTLYPLFLSHCETKLEAELITTKGEILRPDRINILKDEIILLDYKTGQQNDQKYRRQLLQYENALKDLSYEKISKYLVYVDPLQVVPVN